MPLLGNKAVISFLRRFINRERFRYFYCTDSDATERKNLLFFDEKVQELLTKLTEKDLQKIYRKRKEGKTFQTPEYKFMTNEELAEALKEADERADIKLQMPPVLPQRKDVEYTFISDDKLKNYSESKFVFTDITYGKNDRNRVIVVREPDGTLRKANWGERSRMNEIYFPVKGRKLWIPTMFKEEFLKDLLNRKEYTFTLDRACLQFEADDPDYIRVTETVYSHIYEVSEFNALRSTRHYGSFIFYIVSNRKIENLLIENLETDRLQEAVWVIDLFNILNPELKCSYTHAKGDELDYIKAFIDQCSVNKGKLELAYTKYKDILNSSTVKAVN